MGKRSDFTRVPRDFYPTPYEAVIPVLPYLPDNCKFIEPCAGDGRLVTHLEKHGHTCVAQYDIDPVHGHPIGDMMSHQYPEADHNKTVFITNPPWNRKILHPVIENLSSQAMTFLLFDADWMHTKQSSQYMENCVGVISVGRVKWIEGSKMTGKDNCAWYVFDNKPHDTVFIGR